MLALGKLDAFTTPSLGDQFQLAPRTATSASIFAGPKLNYPLFNTILVIRLIQEIGYTDTIIDVRSNRVRSLLGLQADQVDSNT